MRARLIVRFVLLGAVAVAVAGAFALPVHRSALIEGALAGLLGLGLGELFALGLERLVGLRYLHRGRGSRGSHLALVAGIVLVALGFGVFALAHGRSRAVETVAVLGVLAGGLVAVVAFLLPDLLRVHDRVDDGRRAGRGVACGRHGGHERLRA